ncbi:hypothetical protein [Pseudonocardia broussonetiae]|uniref:Uncharacterized protein n=1 Tax=Pseudonocardia broussonetiae TaxID=2736640 RepID=A0A6M6JKW1_9PSEU|nr:hypothetical protein [Pseudonocardia broussonetiae]QJY47710.1 hypothetical protein HOP40_19430 [Pseudonocardia broussonetiae]
MSARGASAAPVAAALAAVAVVVLVLVAAQTGGGSGPAPPGPPPPASLDLGGQSLDRCALAIGAAGLADRYPDRGSWRPLAVLVTDDAVVTLLEDDVPFVCATGPRTVRVSDPAAAVPVGPAALLLTTADGVLAAVAPAGATVDVAVAGTGPPAVAAERYLLRATGATPTRPEQLTVTVAGAAVVPDRLAPPALDLVDRPWVPPRPAGDTGDLLDRCRAVPVAGEPPRTWQTVHLLSHRRGASTAVLLVAVDTGTIGGCAVGPAGPTPLRTWRVGLIGDGARPFTWLPRPGEVLPDVGDDLAAGLVQPAVARMVVTAGTGPPWEASVAGGTFATQLPAGVAPDPRGLTVRALDAVGRVVYEGPAAD